MVGTRDTPPDPLQDNVPPGDRLSGALATTSYDALDEADELTPGLAQKLGRECYDASTNWLNSGRRLKWTDSLRAFQNLHASGSKYLSTDYRYRSRHFRPKTRAMVRKSEAQNAAAFFSNEDVVSIQAVDDDDQQQQASAEILKQLLQYRLTETIPWFLTVQGARQDAEVMGICIGKAYWKFAERFSHTEHRPAADGSGLPYLDDQGQLATEEWDVYAKVEDRPWIDILSPENFRFDAGADWRNPVATSPYLIEMIPMYVHDAWAKVRAGEWLPVAKGALYNARDLDDDIARRAREQGRIPGKDHDAWKPREYDICWVRENIIRYGGQDWHFLSLASAGELLTEPRPLKEVYLHGTRPYVAGFVVVEAHKTYPTSKVELVADLQKMTNDNVNLRYDNVKLALNPRQFVSAGAGFDLNDLRTFMPGKTVVGKDPKNNVVWDRPPEVTASSYAEQDRINLDFDELAGDFTPSSMAASGNPVVPETVGGMEHMAAPSASMNEYELRIFAETFVEPLLRQLVKLEQAYETDPVILAMAGQKAQLFQRFGIDKITDELLNQQLTIRVNVGVGATNPKVKLANFATGAQIIGSIFGPSAAMGANFAEVAKEIFGLLGYKDGKRFFQPDFDPRVQMLQQQLQQVQKGQKGQAQPNPMEMQVRMAEIQKDQQEVEYRRKYDEAKEANLREDNARQRAYDFAKLQAEIADRRRKLAIDEQKLQIEAVKAGAQIRSQSLKDQSVASGDAAA